MQQDNNFQSAHHTGDALLRKLAEAQQRYQIFPNQTDNRPLTVLVGVSGGADSLALLHALAHYAQQWQLQLHVGHLDHNLRPESAAEAAFVGQTAAALQLPFHTNRLPVDALVGQPGGLEAAARRARYAFLLQATINVTPATQVPLLAVAHQADDQAETVLLNLVRGSGLQGLGAMRWSHSLTMPDFMAAPPPEGQVQQIVQLVRPLLNVRRQEIVAYLTAQNLTWCEDPSNADTTLLRNQLRHTILPQLAQINPNVVETLGRTAQLLAGEAERLHPLDQQTLREICLEPRGPAIAETAVAVTPSRVVLDLPALLALALANQRGVLRQALALLQPGLHEIGFAHLESLIWQLRTYPQTGGPHPLMTDLGWSVAGATTQQAARLSLHRMNRRPFAPEQPDLDETWQQTVGVAPLPFAGQLTTVDGWSLQVTRLPIEQLPATWQQRGQPWQTYIDADQVGELVLTTAQPGWRFAPLGMQGRHKMLGDFFTDHKVPTSLRQGWPLIVDRNHEVVVWVCGLRLAHPARITETTRRVLCLRWARS